MEAMFNICDWSQIGVLFTISDWSQIEVLFTIGEWSQTSSASDQSSLYQMVSWTILRLNIKFSVNRSQGNGPIYPGNDSGNVSRIHYWKYASFIVIRIILQFHQFRFPGVSGNFNYFLHTCPGVSGMGKFLCRWANHRFRTG